MKVLEWFLHGNISNDVIITGIIWIFVFLFIGLPSVLLCLAYYALVGSKNTRSLPPSEGQKAKRR